MRRVVSFASVTELIFRCTTTKGVVKKRVNHDAEGVFVRLICTLLSSHTSSSADGHGSDGAAVRVVPHEEREGPLAPQQQPLLAAERHCAPGQARKTLCGIAEAIGS